MTPVDFWFDFGSPYGYLMAERIDALAAAHGRTVRWRPILLFAVLRQLGLPAPLAHAARRDYLLLDVERSARHLGLAYRQPSRFPVVTPLPARLFHVLAAHNGAAAAAFARAALRAAFRDDQALDDAAFAGALAARFDGREAALLLQQAQADGARAALAQAVDEAVRRQVFGSPFVHLDGEPFFGADRLPQIEARLAGRLAPADKDRP
ncbi:MAG: DsbA family protein [Proteobacteria bacterium]|nr:DsbA family protein [Pseudomonadota bacterium]